MKKNTINNQLKQVVRFSSVMPKTINEAINFSDDEMMQGEEGMQQMDGQMEDEEPMEYGAEEEPMAGKSDKINNFIKATRKNALEIMTATNDDEANVKIYEVAKKIWQICEKELNDDKQQQEGQMPNRNSSI